ncbi:hypothetical protein AAII07_42580 [Microvirga sp. 0TCS3.31]
MNEFQENVADTTERTVAERHIEAVRQQGGLFVEAVRRTRMPMLVTDATLPGNPIVFANRRSSTCPATPWTNCSARIRTS